MAKKVKTKIKDSGLLKPQVFLFLFLFFENLFLFVEESKNNLIFVCFFLSLV